MPWDADCSTCGGTGEVTKLFGGKKKCPECYPEDECRPGGKVYDEQGNHIGQTSVGSGRFIPIDEDDEYHRRETFYC